MIIKSEIWVITYCLESDQEAMERTVYFIIFLLRYSVL